MRDGNVAMEVLADVGGFEVARPEMRERTTLGSALLAGDWLVWVGSGWPQAGDACAR
jgi:glycerol kinase